MQSTSTIKTRNRQKKQEHLSRRKVKKLPRIKSRMMEKKIPRERNSSKANS